MVITTAPGEAGQVDYGSGPMVRDPHSGRYRRTRLFAFTLGYSRKSVRLLVWRSTTQIWAELHERAFRRLGGTVRVVVHDNLREGVLTPDIYDPTLNPLYRDVLAHYGVIALPCRVRDPDRKGKVEASIGHAQKTPLKGLRFETLIGAQAYLDRWETRWADTRIHGTTKRQVAAMFAEERPALGPLPLEPFRYYRHGVRTVHLDGCVEVEAAYYSAPPGWIGQRVQVQWDGARVRLLAPTTGVLLREHLRSPRGWHRIHDADRPARTPRSTLTLLARATRAGPGIGTICEGSVARFGITRENPLGGPRYAANPNTLWISCVCPTTSPFAIHRACPLRSACMISMPRKVRHAVVNRLKPSIGRVRRLMNRWSCSMMLFRYLHWRRFERGRTSPSCRTASNATG